VEAVVVESVVAESVVVAPVDVEAPVAEDGGREATANCIVLDGALQFAVSFRSLVSSLMDAIRACT
jgi:hypothetical protein